MKIVNKGLRLIILLVSMISFANAQEAIKEHRSVQDIFPVGSTTQIGKCTVQARLRGSNDQDGNGDVYYLLVTSPHDQTEIYPNPEKNISANARDYHFSIRYAFSQHQVMEFSFLGTHLPFIKQRFIGKSILKMGDDFHVLDLEYVSYIGEALSRDVYSPKINCAL